MDIRNVEAVYPLSPVQEAVLSESLGGGVARSLSNQWSCMLQGALDISAFEQAWQRVLNCYPTLRSSFVWKRVEKPLQVVRKQVDFSLEKEDLTRLSSPQQQERLTALLRQDHEKLLDPSEGPLIRLRLCRMSEESHRLVCTYHRLVLDDWSFHLIFTEFCSYYEQLSQGQTPRLLSSQPYKNYLAWIKQQGEVEAETFWRSALRGFIAPTSIVVARPPGDLPEIEKEYGEQRLSLPPAMTEALHSWVEQHRLSMDTLVRGSWALLLGRYSDLEDVVFGITIPGRPPGLQGVNQMVGPFANRLPLRVRMPHDAPVLQWLKELEQQEAALRRYQYVSPVQVKDWSDVPCDLPMFESSVDLEFPNSDNLVPQQCDGLKVEKIQAVEQLNSIITLKAQLNSESILRIVYDNRCLEDSVIVNMLEGVQTLLEAIITDPDQYLSDLPLLSESRLRQVLVEWNDTNTGAPHDQCIHQLFEAQVRRTPDTLAVIFEDDRLTYSELNCRANQLGQYLRDFGVGPGVLVGLCVERSAEMVIGILGVMKAGGAYVPLDPSYPFERLTAMLADAQPPVLLSQEKVVENLPSYGGTVICLDSDWPAIVQKSEENPDSGVKSDNLAYVIYTSGSTGQPKGVMVPHRGVCNSSDVYARVINMPPGSRMLQLTSIGFDMSIFDIVPALISGLTLCLAPQTAPLGLDLLRILQEQEIEIISFPPSILATLPLVDLPALRFIGVAGEAISAELIAKWASGRRLYNAYGPAEGSIWVAGAFLDGICKPTMGRPIDNIKLYVLDSRLRPVPVGVPGELCISGIGVTWGYLRQPNVTAKKYVPDPFSETPGARLYKTGDLARYLPDGKLEFLGRTDSQVKIRGFRIELGEVEVALGRHPAVQDVVVVAREDVPGDKRLVAYILPQPGQEPTVSDLHGYLKQKLPENMIPSAFVLLDSLPLSPHGKVDRRALPAPDAVRPRLEELFVAPSSHVEETLAKIWCDVLRLERVGIHDNFFELGGHSLLATQVVSRVRDAFQIDLSLPQLFEARTIVALSKIIEGAMGNNSTLRQAPIVPISRATHRANQAVLDSSQ